MRLGLLAFLWVIGRIPVKEGVSLAGVSSIGFRLVASPGKEKFSQTGRSAWQPLPRAIEAHRGTPLCRWGA